MPINKLLENLSEEQKNLSVRIFNLIIGRVLKRTYVGLGEKDRENMEKIMLSENDGEKAKFFKSIKNFKKLFAEEEKIVEKDIKAEIEKISG